MKKFLESEVGQALCRFISREALCILALGIASLFVVTASIYLVVAFCSGKPHLSIKDMSWGIVGTSKGLIITWVYVTLLAISYALSMVFVISNSVRVFRDIVLNVMVLLMVAFFSMHLIVAWIMGSVTEVLEENCCEFDDIAGEEYHSMLKMEEGRDEGYEQREDALDSSRRIQLLKFLLVLTACGVVSYGLTEFGVNEENKRMKIKTVITIMSTCLFLFAELLIFVVFIAFYWGLKKATEEGWSPKDRGFCMLSLPSVMEEEPKLGAEISARFQGNFDLAGGTVRLKLSDSSSFQELKFRRNSYSSSAEISPWDEKPYDLSRTGKKVYLDELDVATFLDPPKELIPLDPASYNPAGYLW
ncbi:hypothetical protein EJ110_NYTH33805 [Nymphaea thermarum]|nr:hypothetical protein EJ110_NYTH33805 [Nymphaea thermarum]